MKRYRVWAYDSVGYYLEIDAQNKADAYNKAMDNHIDDWEKDTRNYLNLKIKKKDIEHIKSPMSPIFKYLFHHLFSHCFPPSTFYILLPKVL